METFVVVRDSTDHNFTRSKIVEFLWTESENIGSCVKDKLPTYPLTIWSDFVFGPAKGVPVCAAGFHAFNHSDVEAGNYQLDVHYLALLARALEKCHSRDETRICILSRCWPTVACTRFISHSFFDSRVLDALPSSDDLRVWRIWPKEWGDCATYCARDATPSEHEKQVLLTYLARCDGASSDVRLDAGLVYRPKAWPRSNIPARALTWSVVAGFPWKRCSEHIK